MVDEHLKICQRNLKSFQQGCWIFEIGNVFDREDNEIIQKGLVSGIICGERNSERWTRSGKPNNLDYFEARGRLHQVFDYLKLDVSDKRHSEIGNLHPGRSSSLVLEGKKLGYFGHMYEKTLWS